MKISLILTTKNEEKSLNPLLDSIKKQTLAPDEIIVTDSNSTDKTVDILKSYQNALPIKIIVKDSNRSEGRNTSIENSNHEIIVSTDAGCILDKDWLKNITAPFKTEDVDVVGGFYLPIINSWVDDFVYLYTSTVPSKLNPQRFLPSSRSVAFKKRAWQKAGGYPNWLGSSEDLYFNLKLRKTGAKFVTAQNAIVYWEPRSRNQSIAKQFYVMAKSSAEAKIIRKTVYLQFLRYLIGALLFILGVNNGIFWQILLFLVIIYAVWSILKNIYYLSNKKYSIFLPPFQIFIDLVVMAGTISGLLARKKRPNIN